MLIFIAKSSMKLDETVICSSTEIIPPVVFEIIRNRRANISSKGSSFRVCPQNFRMDETYIKMSEIYSSFRIALSY